MRAPECLADLSFVLTGELSCFSREEASDVAKKFGGYVCTGLHHIILLNMF